MHGVPRLVEPRAFDQLEAVRNVTGGGFDVDAWHVMDERDNQLIADGIMYGAGSDLFVYSFEVNRQRVSGVSVIGARHLANQYRGLKHRIVGSVSKTGALFEIRAFPFENFAGDTRVQLIPELADEDDYYSCVVEVTDIKTGNSIMVEVREAKKGARSDGSTFERPYYDRIAQSKAYRNAVLALIPQDIQVRWKAEMLKLNKGEHITGSVLEEKRSAVLRFAATKALPLDRRSVEQLTLEQISGLGDAAREGNLPAFSHAAQALGLTMAEDRPPAPQSGSSTRATPPMPETPRRRGRPARQQAASGDPPAGDPRFSEGDPEPANEPGDDPTAARPGFVFEA